MNAQCTHFSFDSIFFLIFFFFITIHNNRKRIGIIVNARHFILLWNVYFSFFKINRSAQVLNAQWILRTKKILLNWRLKTLQALKIECYERKMKFPIKNRYVWMTKQENDDNSDKKKLLVFLIYFCLQPKMLPMNGIKGKRVEEEWGKKETWKIILHMIENWTLNKLIQC